jgi:ornithine carbamoyltransferase
VRPIVVLQKMNTSRKGLLTLNELKPAQINFILKKSLELKHLKDKPQILKSKTLTMIFNKRSTRTRLATETAVSELGFGASSLHVKGGNPIFMSPQDIQLGVNESIKDTAKVVSSMTDLILMRWDRHEDLQEFQKFIQV